ncbi:MULTISPECIES: Rv2175c family DNA-binding protein [Mobiluncus]|uniref:Rv2175c C-terminal domain-containing protein n=3 Tax=Mobiluncus TaxID=2050 RepID=D6ZHK7_MOBCV|nr:MULTISPECIES: Rv2175c family DNA-binding protein [Mobiluncus]ADI68115.1 hypothetical protein HMPREF0573_11796 [Mobiluncus curtisii ATCC 43063]EFU82184.1 hypothetical protein HMPREF0576_0553 [Mobiluncus holmesii ATCC 35242]MCU9987836.1 DNA-binding protein [Mobiluncus curtisii]MCV0000978.1 DNA-binding protein [Mobiluncus curtisii]MCV0020305.1 DNA-binding protein [Mobiluncus curtisii]
MSEIWKEYNWLTISEAAAYLGVEPKAIRSWLKELSLLALPSPEDGKLRIPQVFLVPAESAGDYCGPLEVLRGTLILLRDGGFSDVEAMNWMLSVDDSLGDTPLNALRAGRKKAVRRVAGALAL